MVWRGNAVGKQEYAKASMRSKSFTVRGPRYRGKIRKGDIFGVELKSRKWILGRVIADDAVAFGFEGLYLIYIYSIVLQKPTVPDLLPPTKLLLRPFLATRDPWSFGLFQPLECRDIDKSEKLKSHVFYSDIYNEYYDEYSNETQKSTEAGEFGVHGDVAIEEAIAEAIGPSMRRK